MTIYLIFLLLLLYGPSTVNSMAVDILDVSSMEPIEPNYCNNSHILEEFGLVRGASGQFLGFECSAEFYHCRWQSDGFRTYRKACRTGLVYDTLGTQNCNYDYNVKGCQSGGGVATCDTTQSFHCPLSEQCVALHKRCDGHYDCPMEEDEQNCPLCSAGEFACTVSEECIPIDRRCNGVKECTDGTDELNCEVCGHGQFHCGKSNECVPVDHRCDGHRDCPHGEDEMLCRVQTIAKKFTCESRDEFILMKNVCDGREDCKDGSDEKYCEVPEQKVMSLSSNPRPVQPPPVYPPHPSQKTKPRIVIPQTTNQPPPRIIAEEYEDEEDEEEAEVEDEETDGHQKSEVQDSHVSFPMLNLNGFGITIPQSTLETLAALYTTPTTTPTTRPSTTTTRRVMTSTTTFDPPPPRVLNVVNRPKPKIRPQISVRTTTTTLAPFTTSTEMTYPTEGETEYTDEVVVETTTQPIRTRQPGLPNIPVKGKRIKIKRPTTTMASTTSGVVPKNQIVEQLRGLPDPPKSDPRQRYPTATEQSVIVRVTAPPVYETSPTTLFSTNQMTDFQSKLLTELTAHLSKQRHSGEASQNILSQIEQLLAQNTPSIPVTDEPRTTKKKKYSRRPTWKAQLSSRDVRTFVSRVTKPGDEFEHSVTKLH